MNTKMLTTKIVALFVMLIIHNAFSYNDTYSNVLDLRTAPASKVLILDQPGACREMTVRLPEFSKACYFAGDEPHIRWIGASNRILPWITGSDLADIFNRQERQNPAISGPNRRSIFIFFQLTDGQYLALMPLAGDHSISWLEVNDAGELILGYGSAGTEPPSAGPIPLVAWCRGDDPYAVYYELWKTLIQTPPLKGQTDFRINKQYPEPFEYLGWNSWEQFKNSMNESKLLSVIDGIEQRYIPIRWFVFDYGHADTSAGDQKLMSIGAHPERFPNGYEPFLSRRKDDGIRWFGNWYCLLGYWEGLDKNHTIRPLDPYLMPHPDDANSLIPRVDNASSKQFYDTLTKTVAGQGFDIIKVDNMSRSALDYAQTPNAAMANAMHVQNLEAACKRNNLILTNCSCLNTICILNTPCSAVTRCSIDYRKNKPVESKSHIFQSFANVPWLGQTTWPDHDMFHSSDKDVAAMMSVTKALSGAPIYISDLPEEINMDLVWPLCYADGRVLRTLAPGAPTSGSLLLDAFNERKPYEAVAPMDNQAVAFAAFNLVHPTPETPVQGTVSAQTYQDGSGMIQPYQGPWPVPEEGLYVYDWNTKTGQVLTDSPIRYEIDGFDYTLFILAPIQKGWAVIGRPDKYLTASAVSIKHIQSKSVTVTMEEVGPLVIYSKDKIPTADGLIFHKLDTDLYKCYPTQAKIKITR